MLDKQIKLFFAAIWCRPTEVLNFFYIIYHLLLDNILYIKRFVLVEQTLILVFKYNII